MRGVILTAFLGYLVVLLRAESEPYFGSGSGDIVAITPTNGTKPAIDTTNDDGSGDDDEDGDGEQDGNLASGSGIGSTTEASTTERETTTPETTTQETTTQETTTQGTTAKQTTEPFISPTDDEVDENDSASAYGEPIVLPSSKPQDLSTTTDIYLESSTSDNTVIIIPTKHSTESGSSVKNIRIKTTEKPDISTASSTSEVPTRRSTTARSVEATTKRTANVVDTMSSTTRFVTEHVGTTEQSVPSSEDKTTKDVHETADDSDVKMKARTGTKDDGFTLTTEVIAGVVGCALLALLLIAFLMYRLKKRDEGSYLLDESNAYPEDFKKVHVSDKEAFI